MRHLFRSPASCSDQRSRRCWCETADVWSLLLCAGAMAALLRNLTEETSFTALLADLVDGVCSSAVVWPALQCSSSSSTHCFGNPTKYLGTVKFRSSQDHDCSAHCLSTTVDLLIIAVRQSRACTYTYPLHEVPQYQSENRAAVSTRGATALGRYSQRQHAAISLCGPVPKPRYACADTDCAGGSLQSMFRARPALLSTAESTLAPSP